MNERRDDWAQAFGESVGIVAIGFGLLGTTLTSMRSLLLTAEAEDKSIFPPIKRGAWVTFQKTVGERARCAPKIRAICLPERINSHRAETEASR
jgi:hypothetical protein